MGILMPLLAIPAGKRALAIKRQLWTISSSFSFSETEYSYFSLNAVHS
jgi:hypothetical protein